jgi:hypothetical protein
LRQIGYRGTAGQLRYRRPERKSITTARRREVFAMRRHMLRALAAVVATAGAALTMGLAGAGAAGAATQATHTGSYPIIYTTSQAGYTLSGRWFRYAATTVKVPPAGPVFNYALVALGGSNVAGVNLGIQPGGGPDSIGWAVGSQPFGSGGGALSSVDPKVGDVVRIDLYYNKATGGVTATATDLTANRSQAVTIAEGKSALFTSAEVADFIHNPSSPPAKDIRLWQLTDSHVTTYSGTHGSLTGNWTTSQVMDTTNGKASGHVVFSPSFLFNNGGNFGAWLRTYLR